MAKIEARIDFNDDLPPINLDNIFADIAKIANQVKYILTTAERRELLRTGLKVAIVGRPKVGESSLLNAWSCSDRVKRQNRLI